jgi:hypothetical protein
LASNARGFTNREESWILMEKSSRMPLLFLKGREIV